MTNSEFRDWLRGFFELSPEDAILSREQLQVIVNHLNLAESVDGKLDAFNENLRQGILAFRTADDLEADAVADFSQEMRIRLISQENEG